MTMSLDGIAVFTTAVAATSWATYSAPATIPPGTHTIAFGFTNELSTHRCDRALKLDNVVILPSGPTGKLPPSAAHELLGGCQGGELLELSDRDLGRVLDTAVSLGMRYFRVDINWAHIEPVKGVENWTNADRVIKAIVARGLQPLGLVLHTPPWARAAGTSEEGAPKDPNLFAAFAKAAATRYFDQVKFWEVWNEQNISWAPEPSVTQYAALLKATYTSLKQVSADLFVISGGLSGADDDGPNIAPVPFLQGLYAAGANKYFDAFAMHPYTWPYLPDDPNPWSAWQQMQQMRDVMVAGGDAAKQIWLTEFGAPTGAGQDAVTESVQAQSFQAALQLAKATPWIGPLFVFDIRDNGTNKADTEQNYGLLHNDFTPKPAYRVVRDAGGSV
jgi:hypothetical protein